MDAGSLVKRARRAARPLRRLARNELQRRRERNDPLYALLSEQLRNAPGPDVWEAIWDQRRQLVRSLAPGKSFLDLGGMYGVHGEIAFLAEEVGATRVALFDAMDPTDTFAERHAERGSEIDFFQGDLHDPGIVDMLGEFDVVWCCGVVYHSPHPLQQLLTMAALTKETLVLGSLVLPEMEGVEQVCIFYPGTTPRMQKVFAEAYGGADRFPGMSVPFDEAPNMAYVNMWWGITPSALKAMLRYCGFLLADEYQLSPFSIDLVGRAGRGVPLSIYPTIEFGHDYVRQRLEKYPRDAVPAFAAAQWQRVLGGAGATDR